MLTLKIGGEDIKTVADAMPQANIGLKYAKKKLYVNTATGISFVVAPKQDPKAKGKLILSCPWDSVKMAGVKSGWAAQKLWPQIQKALVALLGNLKQSYNLPDGMMELRKNDEYLGIVVDVVKLRNSVGTFVYEGLMLRLAGIGFNDDDISLSLSIEEAPVPVTRESDDEVEDEDIPEDWDD